MDDAMSWMKEANTTSEYVETVSAWVARAVRIFRSRGHKTDHAIEQTALAFGLTERRTRSLLRREPVAVVLDEYRKIHDRYRDHLRRESLELLEQAEALEAESLQLELKL